MKNIPHWRQVEKELETLVQLTPFYSDYWKRKLKTSHDLYGKYEERDKREVGYLKTKPNRRDIGLVVIYQPRLWTERSLKMRGWNYNRIFFFRSTVDEENEQLAASFRYRAVRVKNMREFLLDEEYLLKDQPEIYEKLERQVFGQFPDLLIENKT